MTRPAFSPKTAICRRARERGCGARRARRAGTHLPQVGLAARVALEPVLIAALLLTHLAVPPKLLEALRLYLIRDRLGRQELVLAHGAGLGGWSDTGTAA